MKIYGNTVGTTLPKPNLDQTDPTKGDYIKGDRTFTKGDDGVTFLPSLDAEGNLSWSNDGGLENPGTVNIMGADGYTPVRGTDYYTEDDKEEMVDLVLNAVPRTSAITVDRNGDTTTMTVAMNDGSASELVITYGANGDPEKITVDGEEIGIEFVYHILQLFSSGNVCESVTGGWTANSNTKGTVTESKTPALDVAGDMVISLSTDKNSAQGSIMTVTAVDLTAYSKLCFNVTALSGGKVEFGITGAPGSGYAFTASAVAAEGLNAIDVSGYSGAYTIAIAVTAYVDDAAGVTIDAIYLE